MKEKSSSPKLIATIIVSLIICFVAYTSVAVCGILTFGSAIDNDLMKNYDATEALVLIGIASLAFKTVTTYPLLLFCARVALEEFYTAVRGPAANALAEKFRRTVIVLVWFISSVVIAIVVPDIGVAIDLLGTLAICFIFVIPGLCLISATLRKDPDIVLLRDKLMCCIGSAYVLVGAFLFGLTITQAILKDFISPQSDKAVPLCV